MSTAEGSTLDVVGAVPRATIIAVPRAAAVAPLVSTSVIAREALVVAILVAGLTAFAAPRDLGAGIAPHPGWAAVILLSARYGSRGFGFALVALCGTLALTAIVTGLALGPLLAVAGKSLPDLTALAVSVLVAWISSAHERRIADLSARAAALAQKSAGDDIIVAALGDAAMALRARGDRLDHSLRARPPDLLLDRTIKAAFESAASVRAIDLPDVAGVAEAGRDQSDVAAPITDEAGDVLGVLALRGVPADSLCHALVHDISLIARWCAKTNGSRDLAIDQTTPATGEPDRRPAPPRAEGSPPSGSQRFN